MPPDSPPLPVASQRVADLLAERILSGRLQPGTRIKQDELADELKTSRIPVRDALRILETRGLVTSRANSGARVASMTIRDLEIAYEIRERIEPMLLENSIPYLRDCDFKEMRMLQAQIEATDDVEIFIARDRQFHWASYSGHRTPQLAQILERIWDTTHCYRRAYAGLALTDQAKIVNAEHHLLLNAIERRNIEVASAVLAMHIRRARVGLRRYAQFSDEDEFA